jgi:IS5 family transposase
MRLRSQKQLYIKPQSKSIPGGMQLKLIEQSLEALPGYSVILDKVSADLNPQAPKGNQGRKGMSAEQVLRSLIVKHLNNYSYRKLADAISDSISVMEFVNLSPFDKGFHYKTLQANIKLIQEDTLDFINEQIKRFAQLEKLEDGKVIRADAFNTESNIHYPTDWSLMNDSIRVLSRTLCRAYEDLGVPVQFTNHYRASKKKLFKINNDKSHKRRRKLNLELIRLTRKTLGYAQRACAVIEQFDGCKTAEDFAYLDSLLANLKHFIPLVESVIDQAHRRIVKGQKVPSQEKIVSLFEEHTDVISKGSRQVIFGHKNTITTGTSGLILNIDIHEGNPADSTLVKDVINNVEQFYGTAPDKAVFDGCYSSSENREFAQVKRIKQVCFSKETDEQSSISRSARKKLRYFRAGIEATVSMLMRMFGMTRILNKGLRSFKNTAKAAVVTYNLFILSRAQLKT